MLAIKGYHEADEDNDDDALEEENSDSGSDAEGANNNNGDASIIANDDANNNPVKKKRRNRDDVYDHEDWFVDDSEDAVVLRVEAKRYETKHSGFFVSEGSLDVNTARSIASSKPVKKVSVHEVKDSSATNNKVSSVKAKTPQSAGGGGAMLSQSTTPLNKLISTISSTSPTRLVSNNSSEKQVSGADDKQKRTRTYIPKPEYVAAESVKGGIDVVKEEVKRLKSMNDNRKFHFIPDALDGYLLLLDDLVRQHNPEIYNNTHIGYFEEISQAILDTQKPKVMKSYLTCIRGKRDAKHHLQEYSRLTDELVHEAKNNIVPFVAPSNTDISHDNTELTATDSQSQLDISTDGVKSKPKVDYKWTCSWKPAMRSLLSAIDKHLQLYVHHTNICRSNMSNHEREKLQPDEAAVIDSKVYITMHLKAIVSRGFPDACKNGDMTYLRTIISQEKNKESKKSGNKSPSHSPTKVSVATSNSVAAVKRKSEEVKTNEPSKKSMKVDDKSAIIAAPIVCEPLKGTSFRQIEFNIEDFTCID